MINRWKSFLNFREFPNFAPLKILGTSKAIRKRANISRLWLHAPETGCWARFSRLRSCFFCLGRLISWANIVPEIGTSLSIHGEEGAEFFVTSKRDPSSKGPLLPPATPSARDKSHFLCLPGVSGWLWSDDSSATTLTGLLKYCGLHSPSKNTVFDRGAPPRNQNEWQARSVGGQGCELARIGRVYARRNYVHTVCMQHSSFRKNTSNFYTNFAVLRRNASSAF